MTTFLYRLMLVLLIPAFIMGCLLAAAWQAGLFAACLWRKFWDEASHA